MYRYLLLVRFGLFNLVGVSFLASVYMQGWLDAIIKADLVELSAIIAALFVYGWIFCAHRIWRTSLDLNELKAGTPSPDSLAGIYLTHLETVQGSGRDVLRNVLRLKLTNRIAVVRHVANSLVFLGLIGTVIGFIIALSGVDPTRATDPEMVGGMISTLISGMSVALNTTLVGAVLYVWLIVNHRLLAGGTVDLLTTALEYGEAPQAAPGGSAPESLGESQGASHGST